MISVTEDDDVIDTILRVCYPGQNPTLDPISIESNLEVGKKYQMENVTTHG